MQNQQTAVSAPRLRRCISGHGVAEPWNDLIAPSGAPAYARRDWWLGKAVEDPSYADVKAWLQRFRHTVIYDLKVEDIERVVSSRDPAIRTEHPMFRPGTNRRKYIGVKDPEVRAVENYQSAWAFSYLFHRMLEESGRVFRWSEFCARIVGDWAPLYWEPLIRRHDAVGNRPRQRELAIGLHFRMGCAYYSFLRELDFMARLREHHGLDIRYHVWADVLFGVDFWYDRTVIGVYLSNPKFRDEIAGRKNGLGSWLSSSLFEVVSFGKKMRSPTKGDRAEMFEPKLIADLADRLRGAVN